MFALPHGIDLVPSTAFGDGRHPTTRMCMQAVTAFAPELPFRMLDVGSGTGVLAILAAKLGASAAIGVEIDGPSNEVAEANAAKNHVADRTSFGTAWPEGTFALVVANILEAVLVVLREDVTSRVAEGGTLVLSGLVSTDVPSIVARYAPLLGGARPDVYQREEWRTLVWRRTSRTSAPRSHG